MATVRQDLLQILAKEHREHRDALHEMMTTGGRLPARTRRRGFNSLVVRIGTQLAAEEVLVHPLVERLLPHGTPFVEERRSDTRRIMAGLADAGDHIDEDLSEALGRASHAFVTYTDHQEVEGFLVVRQRTAPPWLRRLGRVHEHLRRLLPGRYLRESVADVPAWADPDLLTTFHEWYRLEVARDGQRDGEDAALSLVPPVAPPTDGQITVTAPRWTHR